MTWQLPEEVSDRVRDVSVNALTQAIRDEADDDEDRDMLAIAVLSRLTPGRLVTAFSLAIDEARAEHNRDLGEPE
jgi:hypothetical protein